MGNEEVDLGEWEGLSEFVRAVYMAQKFGIMDPRLEPIDVDDDRSYFTEEELQELEEWVERLDNHKE